MTGTANEKFNTANIRTAALKLLSSQLTETTVNFSVERENKRFAINATPTNSNDEFVVSLELRVKGFDNLKLNMLDALALAELQERATNAAELEKRDARIAELEALLSSK